jgi:SAM-dependent methyltransferase
MRRVWYAVLLALGRFNDRHPWSHNDFYTQWVLRQARRISRHDDTRALDVGCGTGNLAKRLAGVVDFVVAIEPDPRTAARARNNLSTTPNTEVRQIPFDSVTGGGFDLITFVAVLHHLPLSETIGHARSLLRADGRLVVVGVALDAPGDWPWALPSMVLNPIIGVLKHPRRARALPANMTAPIAPAVQTFPEIARVIRHKLPGVVIHRGLFWRYTALWIAPPATTSAT